MVISQIERSCGCVTSHSTKDIFFCHIEEFEPLDQICWKGHELCNYQNFGRKPQKENIKVGNGSLQTVI
jgi:hypothetical protein